MSKAPPRFGEGLGRGSPTDSYGRFSGGAAGEVHHSPIAAIAFAPLTLGGVLVGRGLMAGRSTSDFVRRALAVAGAGLASFCRCRVGSSDVVEELDVGSALDATMDHRRMQLFRAAIGFGTGEILHIDGGQAAGR